MQSRFHLVVALLLVAGCAAPATVESKSNVASQVGKSVEYCGAAGMGKFGYYVIIDGTPVYFDLPPGSYSIHPGERIAARGRLTLIPATPAEERVDYIASVPEHWELAAAVLIEPRCLN
jgi:hypothetical protein